MKKIILIIMLMFITTVPVKADEKKIPGILNTINGQMSAFLEDDFEKAFTFASPSIRAIFQTPERFGQMVIGGYPMVWRPNSVKFMGVRLEGGYVIQTVFLKDSSGNPHFIEYAMEKFDEVWKISGVHLLNSSAVGT